MSGSGPSPGCRIVGVVNLTADSFSDGGRYLEPRRAIEHALELAAAGADLIELGAASSHPDAAPVEPGEEIRRLAPVIEALRAQGLELAVDAWKPETQRECLGRGVQMLNDIQGFADPGFHRELARSDCTLVVMHSIQGRGPATRAEASADAVVEGVYAFFRSRIAELQAAGVCRERIVLDPGMGYFVGSDPEPSLALLNEIPRLKRTFGLPVLVCVSRKSFLGALTGRAVEERGAATLSAELSAATLGCDYIRTHDVAALRDALTVRAALAGSRRPAELRRD
ncbi:MAG: dihydropteroate synthase [Myxococcota bacterium]